MKRILPTSLVLSVLLLPACKGGSSADAVKLVPDEAEFIVGFSPKAVGESEIYKKFAPEFENEEDFKKMVATFKDCGLDPFKFDAVVVGANQGGEVVAIVSGDSVGKKDEAVCVMTKIREETGETGEIAVTKEGGKSIIEFTDARAYLVNDNMLAIVTTDWRDAVGELIDGKGTPAVDNSKKDLMGKVDTKRAVWFVATVPPDMAAMAAMAGPELTEVKNVAGSLDLSSGVAIELIAGFDAEDKAKAAADKTQALFDENKGQAGEDMSGVTNSVKIEASGSDVKISAAASMADIEAAKSKIPM